MSAVGEISGLVVLTLSSSRFDPKPACGAGARRSKIFTPRPLVANLVVGWNEGRRRFLLHILDDELSSIKRERIASTLTLDLGVDGRLGRYAHYLVPVAGELPS